MPTIVQKPVIPVILPPPVAVEPDLTIEGIPGGCNVDEYEREERLAIMTIEGGLTEEEARQYLGNSTTPVDEKKNEKIKPWNPNSETPYLEFWFKGEMVGGAHVPPEHDAEITERFFARYEKRYATIKERMSEEKKRSLFRGHIKTW